MGFHNQDKALNNRILTEERTTEKVFNKNFKDFLKKISDPVKKATIIAALAFAFTSGAHAQFSNKNIERKAQKAKHTITLVQQNKISEDKAVKPIENFIREVEKDIEHAIKKPLFDVYRDLYGAEQNIALLEQIIQKIPEEVNVVHRLEYFKQELEEYMQFYHTHKDSVLKKSDHDVVIISEVQARSVEEAKHIANEKSVHLLADAYGGDIIYNTSTYGITDVIRIAEHTYIVAKQMRMKQLPEHIDTY